MPAINQRWSYEVHRPVSHLAMQTLATALLPERDKAIFLKSLEGAGNRTGGPVLRDGKVAIASSSELEECYWKWLKQGIDPCYVDKRDDYLYVGDYVFVPVNRPMPQEECDD